MEASVLAIRSVRLAALLVGAALAVTACGADSHNDVAAPGGSINTASINAVSPAEASVTQSSAGSAASAVVPAESAAAAASGDTSAAATEECGEAALSVRAALASAGGTVTDVKVIGQCTTVSVSTTLTPDADGSQVAKALCTTAGAEAYGKGITSVSIDAADGTELAIGIKDAPCIGPFG